MSVIIYHNPRCSKSRETLKLLQEQHIEPKIELYLENRYSIDQLKDLMKKLGIVSAREMMRVKDDLYKDLQLDAQKVTEEQLLQAISEHSALLERPIVINGDKAKIGRPPEVVLSIL
ncbi:arsenate reductase (glutaredoxin) [Pasteurella bettyae]|uniref:arsenate reductase (glutaredoxin) n=1 Tax=Pasteurella bettyae TaxID=752 RepID=UPI003D2A4119